MKAESTKGPKKKKNISKRPGSTSGTSTFCWYDDVKTGKKNTPTEHMDKTKKKKKKKSSKHAYRNPE
jgi:hypothetical protein